MINSDFEVVCSTIEREKRSLNDVSQEIWKNPELLFKEFKAHDILTSALTRYGFQVQPQYVMPTGFRAEYPLDDGSQPRAGATVCVLLEYDALPDLGHACGHNLIAEVGLAAAIAVRAALIADPTLKGKLVVLGSPAEEGGGGKIKLIEAGAFEGVDAALMAHPTRYSAVAPKLCCASFYAVDYKGKEVHAASFPWEGRNALDAAVACYQNLALLRQHIRPTEKINVVISDGGKAPNVIPARSSLRVILRAATRADMRRLEARAVACMRSAAEATGCEVAVSHDEGLAYEDLLTNKVMGDVYRDYAQHLGLDTTPSPKEGTASTDMGNVSHAVPSIQPCFAIGSAAANHTEEFAEAAGAEGAQGPALLVAMALALTALKLMRSPHVLEKAKRQFARDLDAEED